MKPIFFVIISVSVLLSVSFAQSAGEQKAEQKVLDNSDVIMLAKAGFSADFIIDTIHSGKSNFDTSATGLAALAKEGLNEQILRVIAGVKSPAAQAPPQPSPPPSTEYVPGMQGKVRTQVIKPSAVGLAMATQTPYYASTTFLFGLLHKRVGVSIVPRGDQVAVPQMGTSSNSYRMMTNFPAVVAPAGSAVRYVVIP